MNGIVKLLNDKYKMIKLTVEGYGQERIVIEITAETLEKIATEYSSAIFSYCGLYVDDELKEMVPYNLSIAMPPDETVIQAERPGILHADTIDNSEDSFYDEDWLGEYTVTGDTEPTYEEDDEEWETW